MRIRKLYVTVLFAFLVALLCMGVTASATDIVGLPSSGFKVKGLDISGRDVAGMLYTDLGHASCYDKPDGFYVVETDPDKLKILQDEIDRSNSKGFDPSTRMKNRYVPPNKLVSGTWYSDGKNLTVTLLLKDSHGKTLLSKSGSGPAKDFFDISSKVGKELADAMCGGNWKCKCNGQMYKSAGACAGSCPHASLRCMAPTCLEMNPETGKWTGKGI